MKPTHTVEPVEKSRQTFLRVILVFVAYYGLWVVSRFIQPVSYAVYGVGIAFPVLSAMVTRDWSAIGFTRRNWKPALLWGAAVGLILLLGIVIVPGVLRLQPSLPTHPRQLVGGIALSFLLISPFQEFLFRGWMQPRLESVLGKTPGLIVCSLLFAIWDTLPPLQGASILATIRTSLLLVPFSFGFGLVVGYIFQRTGNILAPWLAHSLAVAALVTTGRVVLLESVS